MSLLKTPKRVFFVRSAEQSLCPCCESELKVIGSRKRVFINSLGEKVTLIIRRLKCRQCNRVHHELPDILVPYKRYGSESIEAAISEDTGLTVSADDSTIRLWRKWFKKISEYLLGCLVSIDTRYGKGSVKDISVLPKSALQRIQHHVGNAPGWLARVVRPVTNHNLWLQTRLAFLA